MSEREDMLQAEVDRLTRALEDSQLRLQAERDLVDSYLAGMEDTARKAEQSGKLLKAIGNTEAAEAMELVSEMVGELAKDFKRIITTGRSVLDIFQDTGKLDVTRKVREARAAGMTRDEILMAAMTGTLGNDAKEASAAEPELLTLEPGRDAWVTATGEQATASV